MRARWTAGIAAIVAAAVATLLWLARPQIRPTIPHQPQARVGSAQPIRARPTMFTASLEDLRSRGESSAPDICAALQRGENFAIKETDRSDAWAAFPTPRAKLLALLGEIGGAEAAACARQIALTTEDPLELALAGRLLEEQQPGQHREMLARLAHNLLKANPGNAEPLLPLLAHLGARQAVADIERWVLAHPDRAELAIGALSWMHQHGGDAALVNLWRRPELPTPTREQLAHALGVTAPHSQLVRREVAAMFSAAAVHARFKRAMLNGLATGEARLDTRFLPRNSVVWAMPQTDWIVARLALLDELQLLPGEPAMASELQQVRDELLAELEKTQ